MPSATVMNDDEVLDFTQVHRRKLVEKLTETTPLPADPKEQATLLKALDGLDKAALGKKRIQVEEKGADAQAEAAKIMAHVLSGTAFNRKSDTPNLSRKAPVLGSDVPEPILIEGETSMTTMHADYNQFMGQADSAP